MRLLDLFCGAGGAAMGYHRAGFDDVVGVDLEPQANYPFHFIQADALSFLDAMIDGREDIAFDLIHASPPCQRWSPSRHREDHPDFVGPVRERLDILGIPYVIENVPQAPLRKDIVLCGSMFGLEIRRHRVFETTTTLPEPPDCHHHWDNPKAPFLVAGHGGGWAPGHKNYYNLAHAKELMEMPWCETRPEVVEAIPPAYTRFIGEQFLAALSGDSPKEDTDE